MTLAEAQKWAKDHRHKHMVVSKQGLFVAAGEKLVAVGARAYPYHILFRLMNPNVRGGSQLSPGGPDIRNFLDPTDFDPDPQTRYCYLDPEHVQLLTINYVWPTAQLPNATAPPVAPGPVGIALPIGYMSALYGLPRQQLPNIDVNPPARKVIAEFPHTCTKCAKPAYISPVTAQVDCSAKCGATTIYQRS